jgi:hypothetical protein
LRFKRLRPRRGLQVVLDLTSRLVRFALFLIPRVSLVLYLIWTERVDEYILMIFLVISVWSWRGCRTRAGACIEVEKDWAVDSGPGEHSRASFNVKQRTKPTVFSQFDSSPTGSVASTLIIPDAPALPLQPLTARQKITIRSDPALFTCFDPRDTELYDLWVPKA